MSGFDFMGDCKFDIESKADPCLSIPKDTSLSFTPEQSHATNSKIQTRPPGVIVPLVFPPSNSQASTPSFTSSNTFPLPLHPQTTAQQQTMPSQSTPSVGFMRSTLSLITTPIMNMMSPSVRAETMSDYHLSESRNTPHRSGTPVTQEDMENFTLHSLELETPNSHPQSTPKATAQAQPGYLLSESETRIPLSPPTLSTQIGSKTAGGASLPAWAMSVASSPIVRVDTSREDMTSLTLDSHDSSNAFATNESKNLQQNTPNLAPIKNFKMKPLPIFGEPI